MGPSETMGPSSMGAGSGVGSVAIGMSVDFTRRDRRGDGFLIIGRLHGRRAAATRIGPACRRRAGTVLGIVGCRQRLGFEHDLAQRGRGPRRRIGGHVAPRGKVRLRAISCVRWSGPSAANDSRRVGAEACWTRACVGFRVVAKNPLAGHVRHVAAGQGLDRALQADLLAYAGFQLDTLCRGHVAANHTPAIEDDVGGRPVVVGGIAV